ncbi:MAG: hypothetical protein QXO48_00920 [Desulfurococcaceae archaeon]
MIDSLCFTGHYPFRKLSIVNLTELTNLMLREGFQSILVLHFSSLFYRNPWVANEELLSESGKIVDEIKDRIRVYLLAGINPEYAVSREKLAGYKGAFRGVVVAPLYHGFKLSSKNTRNLLKIVSDLDLTLGVLGYLEDPREAHRAYAFRYKLTLNDARSFIREVKEWGYSRVVLYSFPSELLFQLSSDISNASILVDVSSNDVYGPIYDYVKTLVESVGEDLVVFSSKAPLTYVKSALFKVLYSEISSKAKEKILRDNPRRLFNIC